MLLMGDCVQDEVSMKEKRRRRRWERKRKKAYYSFRTAPVSEPWWDGKD
jgi:hypothetical protein